MDLDSTSSDQKILLWPAAVKLTCPQSPFGLIFHFRSQIPHPLLENVPQINRATGAEYWDRRHFGVWPHGLYFSYSQYLKDWLWCGPCSHFSYQYLNPLRLSLFLVNPHRNSLMVKAAMHQNLQAVFAVVGSVWTQSAFEETDLWEDICVAGPQCEFFWTLQLCES